MQFFSSIIAIAAIAGFATAAPAPAENSVDSAAGRNCDPVGCYPDTSFSVLGNFNGNGKIDGKLYYRGKTTDFKWQCDNKYHGVDSNLPYVFSIRESAGLYCNAEYKFVSMKYGAINADPISNNPNCAKTAKYSYRCIFKADGSNGSGL